MTAQEELLAWLQRNGVEHTVEQGERRDHADLPMRQVTVVQLETKTAKVQGYGGFLTEFCFTPTGELDYIGIWE